MRAILHYFPLFYRCCLFLSWLKVLNRWISVSDCHVHLYKLCASGMLIWSGWNLENFAWACSNPYHGTCSATDKSWVFPLCSRGMLAIWSYWTKLVRIAISAQPLLLVLFISGARVGESKPSKECKSSTGYVFQAAFEEYILWTIVKWTTQIQ